MGVFLRKSALPGLKNYKYSSVDNSLVSRYVLRPFWLQFVKIFPLWLAPNLVTLIGFSFIVVNFLTVLYFNASFDQICPPWVYASYGIGLFLYQTFDAVDGQQARRTGQSSPLGELFDHCVDAVNTTLGTLIFASAINMGYGWPIFISQFATLTNFYLSTWEEYHTGTLFLSVFSGPVEGILVIIGLEFFIASQGGPAIFHENIVELFNLTELISSFGDSVPPLVYKLNVIDAYMGIAAVCLLFNIFSATGNVIVSCKKNGSSISQALIGTTPYLAFYASLTGWALIAPIVINTHLLVPFTLSTGAIVALSVGRIITAHVTSSSFPRVSAPMFIPAVAIVFNLLVKNEILLPDWNLDATNTGLVWLSLGASVATYGFFVAELIVEITTYLDIWCLSIKHPKAPVSSQEKTK